MLKQNELTLKVYEYRNRREIRYYGKCTKSRARGIARFMSEYYKYLQNVLERFRRVQVTIDEHNAMRVKYDTGESKVLLDIIYLELLLPEIESLLKQYRRKIKYISSVKIAA